MNQVERVKLKDLIIKEIRNGYSPVCVEKPTGMWVLGLGALTDNGLDVTQIKAITLVDFKKNFLLENGDFLVSRSNTLDKVGRSLLYRGEIKNCLYPDLMMKFRVDSNKVYPEFLEVFLKSEFVVKYFQRCAAGTSGSMVKITKKVLEKLEVPLLEFKQQQKIATILKKWDEAISLTEQLIEKKRKYKEILISSLLTKKISFYKYKNKIWKKYQLGNVCNIRTGKRDANHGAEDGKYPFFTCSKEIKRINNYSFDTEAILIAGNGDVGHCKYYDGKFDAYQRTYVLSDFKNIEAVFCFYILQTFFEKSVKNQAQKSAMPYIKLSTLSRFELTVPLKEEQSCITKFANAIVLNEEIGKNVLLMLQVQKSNLMRLLMTGKLRVKTDTKEKNV